MDGGEQQLTKQHFARRALGELDREARLVPEVGRTKTKTEVERDRLATPRYVREPEPTGFAGDFAQPAVELALHRVLKQAGIRCARPTSRMLFEERLQVGDDLRTEADVTNLEFTFATEESLVPNQARSVRGSYAGAGRIIQRQRRGGQ